jgi:site-specific DNA-methyltransferase (adenine-specific)
MEINIDLRLGDCLEVLKTIPDNSVDSVVTDPPYGLGFMNKEWDSPEKLRQLTQREQKRSAERKADGKSPTDAPFSKSVPPGLAIKGAKEGKWFQDWCELWAAECLRILKPGGHILSFSAPRTYHRMATAFEDAGFEIRDQLMWVFGSGFPKSHNIGKAIKEENDWNGWGTALKPAHEPIVMGRKPLSEKSIADNVLKHGTGGINIDGSRVEMKDKGNINFDRPRVRKDQKEYFGNHLPDGYFKNEDFKEYNEAGRFPANIIFDEEAGQLLDEQSGKSKTKANKNYKHSNTETESNTFTGRGTYTPREDEGGASRFFYCPKAAKKDRNEGDVSNGHPTVKPTDLMRYLINLITPPNGVVLDPFMGSGSTGKAAVRCGLNFIGIEKEQEYMNIAEQRINNEKIKGGNLGM